MHPTRLLMAAGIVAATVGLTATPAPAMSAVSSSCNHVYIFLGFANVFSQGMYKLSRRLKQAGYSVSVHNWMSGGSVANKLRRRHGAGNGTCQVAVVGHSSGGSTSVEVANEVKGENIPIQVLIMYDTTAPRWVGSNVKRAVSFYVNGGGKPIQGDQTFRGTLVNRDVSGLAALNHFNIDSSMAVHDLAFAEIRQAMEP